MQPKSSSSWIQLTIFTIFLFLLVAIPYTIYLKATQSKNMPEVTSLPVVAKPSPLPPITPPPASANTTCIPVPNTYTSTTATPAAYLFPEKGTTICYPAALPPFPFTWTPYTNYQLGYSIDTPTNWVNKTTTVKGTVLHIFASDDTGTTAASVSFAWYKGTDPYATDAAYLKKPHIIAGQPGNIYTQSTGFIAAIVPFPTGYFLLEGSTIDSAFYAFQHMLDSVKFTQ